MVGGYFEKNPMTNKIKKFLYTLEHLIPDAHKEIPTFALYHPLLDSDSFPKKIRLISITQFRCWI